MMKPHFGKCGLLLIKEVMAFGNRESIKYGIPSLRSTGVVPAESCATAWEQGNQAN